MKYPVDLLNATALLIGDSWWAVTSVEESATDGWLRIRTPGRGNEAINVRSESILAFRAADVPVATLIQRFKPWAVS